MNNPLETKEFSTYIHEKYYGGKNNLLSYLLGKSGLKDDNIPVSKRFLDVGRLVPNAKVEIFNDNEDDKYDVKKPKRIILDEPLAKMVKENASEKITSESTKVPKLNGRLNSDETLLNLSRRGELRAAMMRDLSSMEDLLSGPGGIERNSSICIHFVEQIKNNLNFI